MKRAQQAYYARKQKDGKILVHKVWSQSEAKKLTENKEVYGPFLANGWPDADEKAWDHFYGIKVKDHRKKD